MFHYPIPGSWTLRTTGRSAALPRRNFQGGQWFRAAARTAAWALLLVLSSSARLTGDELTLSAQAPRTPQVGQIQLLPGPIPMHAGRIFPLLFSGGLEPTENAITAGELWSFFRQQGLREVHSIMLFLDVDKLPSTDSIRIQSIEFRIEPVDATAPLTCCSLGDQNSLLIPGEDSLAAMPEARLEIPLGYDFMQRYSEASAERVFLKLDYQAPAGSTPNFFIAGQQAWFTLPRFLLLLGFTAFWGAIFLALFRLTLKPWATASGARRVS